MKKSEVFLFMSSFLGQGSHDNLPRARGGGGSRKTWRKLEPSDVWGLRRFRLTSIINIRRVHGLYVAGYTYGREALIGISRKDHLSECEVRTDIPTSIVRSNRLSRCIPSRPIGTPSWSHECGSSAGICRPGHLYGRAAGPPVNASMSSRVLTKGCKTTRHNNVKTDTFAARPYLFSRPPSEPVPMEIGGQQYLVVGQIISW